MPLPTPVLADGLKRLAAHMETVADELNALDGQLGDGDLGVTMTRGGRALVDILPTLPADVGMALMACAQAMTKVSGSSYGTLLATGLLAAAKATRGRTEVPWSRNRRAPAHRAGSDDDARQGIPRRQDGAGCAGRHGNSRRGKQPSWGD